MPPSSSDWADPLTIPLRNRCESGRRTIEVSQGPRQVEVLHGDVKLTGKNLAAHFETWVLAILERGDQALRVGNHVDVTKAGLRSFPQLGGGPPPSGDPRGPRIRLPRNGHSRVDRRDLSRSPPPT